MDYEILKLSLKEDQENGNGEILFEDEDGIAYYDYQISCGDDYIFFKKPEKCTKDNLEKIIFVGKDASKRNVNANYIANILADAYGDDLIDMMMVLRAVVVVGSESDLLQFARLLKVDDDEIIDEMGDMENCCGRSWFRKQIAFIYENTIFDVSEDCVDEYESIESVYSRGIGSTAIHECRHVMLDGNPFLDEEKYPLYFSSEENVEEFCRDCWDRIGSKYLLSFDKKEGV